MPTPVTTRRQKQKVEDVNRPPKGEVNGYLSPDSAYPRGFGSAYWRNLSRSPSPLGLIPIHREWRIFIHKHEIPRKFLHVSIGFATLFLYWRGVQTSQIHPYLLGALVPIFATDLIRFQWPAFNRFYIRMLGGFMRESEAHDKFNGVIGYLAGLWVTLRFCPKDVAVMSVLLLSWCDTAASTFGRLWGKYTPRIRRGKSLAGSLAAFAVGVVTAGLFWGVLAPLTDPTFNTGENAFAFQGTLTLPAPVRDQFHLGLREATISGWPALGVLSFASGLTASVSEAIDLWGLDDNLTIPILSGIGLGGFLWVFGFR
jgi:diacylglycerol kinase (CTP)